MADGTKLVIKADTMGGQKTFSFNYVDPSATSANLRAVAQALLDNGSIYKYPPLQIASISLQTTTTATIPLS